VAKARRKKKKGSPRKVERFRCWWCQRVLALTDRHHTFARRGCCNDCYRDEGSNYALAYGGFARERREVTRVRVEEARENHRFKWCSGCVRGHRSGVRCPTCDRPLGSVPASK